MQVRVRVRSSKIEVRCASACEIIIEMRVCLRHTVKFLTTQRLIIIQFLFKQKVRKDIFSFNLICSLKNMYLKSIEIRNSMFTCCALNFKSSPLIIVCFHGQNNYKIGISAHCKLINIKVIKIYFVSYPIFECNLKVKSDKYLKDA